MRLSTRTLPAVLAAAAMLLGAGCAQQTPGPRFQTPGAASASTPGDAEQPFAVRRQAGGRHSAAGQGDGRVPASRGRDRRGRSHGGAESAEEAVQYDPGNATLRITLATLYVRDGRLADASGSRPTRRSSSIPAPRVRCCSRPVSTPHWATTRPPSSTTRM